MFRALASALALVCVSTFVHGKWENVADEWPDITQGQKDWFKGLHNSNGFICCDTADGHPIDQWDIRDGHYWAFFRDKWIEIPDEAVVKQPNRVGSAVLWWGQLGVRCFVAGSEG